MDELTKEQIMALESGLEVHYAVTLSTGLKQDADSKEIGFQSGLCVEQKLGPKPSDAQIKEWSETPPLSTIEKLYGLFVPVDREYETHYFDSLKEVEKNADTLYQQQLSRLRSKYSSRFKNSLRGAFRSAAACTLGIITLPCIPVGIVLGIVTAGTGSWSGMVALIPLAFLKSTFGNFKYPERLRAGLIAAQQEGKSLPEPNYSHDRFPEDHNVGDTLYFVKKEGPVKYSVSEQEITAREAFQNASVLDYCFSCANGVNVITSNDPDAAYGFMVDTRTPVSDDIVGIESSKEQAESLCRYYAQEDIENGLIPN